MDRQGVSGGRARTVAECVRQSMDGARPTARLIRGSASDGSAEHGRQGASGGAAWMVAGRVRRKADSASHVAVVRLVDRQGASGGRAWMVARPTARLMLR